MTAVALYPALTAATGRAADLPDILTTAEAARYSRRHPQTLLAAMRSGQLRASQRSRNANWRIQLLDLQRWVDGLPPRPPTAARLPPLTPTPKGTAMPPAPAPFRSALPGATGAGYVSAVLDGDADLAGSYELAFTAAELLDMALDNVAVFAVALARRRRLSLEELLDRNVRAARRADAHDPHGAT